MRIPAPSSMHASTVACGLVAIDLYSPNCNSYLSMCFDFSFRLIFCFVFVRSQPPRREAQFRAHRKDDSQESGRCRVFSRSSRNSGERCPLRRNFQQPAPIHPCPPCQERRECGSGPVRSRLCGCRYCHDRLRAAQLRAECAVCQQFKGTGAIHRFSSCGSRPRDAAGLRGGSLSSATVAGWMGDSSRGRGYGLVSSNFWGASWVWSPTRIFKQATMSLAGFRFRSYDSHAPRVECTGRTERGRRNRSRCPSSSGSIPRRCRRVA